jgi:hypothetical protein
MALQLNNTDVTPEHIYHLIADGQLFNEAPREAQTLKAFNIGPAHHLFQFIAHSYMVTAADVIDQVFPILRRIEAALPQHAITPPRCILCLSKSETFSSEEHVIPESLGGDTLVLPRGAVCDTCNNGIGARLDAYLITFPPLAVPRTMYLPQKKDGTFPGARLAGFTLQRVAPRTLRFTIHGKRDPFSPQKPDGSQDITWKQPQHDLHRIARALMRIGLGLLAHDLGVERAYHPDFDPARSFICGAPTFAGTLVLAAEFQPEPTILAQVLEMESTTVFFGKFFGLAFGITLLPTPEVPPPEPDDGEPAHVVNLRVPSPPRESRKN